MNYMNKYVVVTIQDLSSFVVLEDNEYRDFYNACRTYHKGKVSMQTGKNEYITTESGEKFLDLCRVTYISDEAFMYMQRAFPSINQKVAFGEYAELLTNWKDYIGNI